MIKKLSLFAVSVFLLLIAVCGYAYWQNNKTVEYPPRASIEHSFDKVITWLQNNQQRIEKIHNPILWWMLKQASEKTDDARLTQIYKHYESSHLSVQPSNLWTPMFREYYRPRVPEIELFTEYRDYQLFFVYGLSCDNNLYTEPVIQAQLKPEFCAMHYLHPRCVTHQMMGVRFMQRYRCATDAELSPLIIDLQNIIVSELTYDFRVGDAYIQRIMMLLDSGAMKAIKPIWIQRFLAAQNVDGGWDDVDPIITLPNGKHLAFTSTLPRYSGDRFDFHATAQAVYLLALLLDEEILMP